MRREGARQRQNTGNVTAAERPLLGEAGDAATRGWMTVGLDRSESWVATRNGAGVME